MGDKKCTVWIRRKRMNEWLNEWNKQKKFSLDHYWVNKVWLNRHIECIFWLGGGEGGKAEIICSEHCDRSSRREKEWVCVCEYDRQGGEVNGAPTTHSLSIPFSHRFSIYSLFFFSLLSSLLFSLFFLRTLFFFFPFNSFLCPFSSFLSFLLSSFTINSSSNNYHHHPFLLTLSLLHSHSTLAIKHILLSYTHSLHVLTFSL